MGIEAFHLSEDHARYLTDEVITVRKRTAEITQLITTLDQERRDLVVRQIILTGALKEHISTSVDQLCDGDGAELGRLKYRWYGSLQDDILALTEQRGRVAGDGPATSPANLPNLEIFE
jgi:hypothetical protein